MLSNFLSTKIYVFSKFAEYANSLRLQKQYSAKRVTFIKIFKILKEKLIPIADSLLMALLKI